MGTVAETTKGESAPRILIPALEGVRNLVYPHKATAPSSVHRGPPGRAPHTAASGLNELRIWLGQEEDGGVDG